MVLYNWLILDYYDRTWPVLQFLLQPFMVNICKVLVGGWGGGGGEGDRGGGTRGITLKGYTLMATW